MKEVKIKSKQTIVGRGLVFLVDLYDHGFSKEEYINASDLPFKVGDNITVDEKTYMITGVEAQGILIFENKKIKNLIGLVVVWKN
jgi:hypothetical protein